MALLKYDKDITIQRDDIGWYYSYIIKLLVENYTGVKDVVLGKSNAINNELLIDVQWEHTLVDSIYMRSRYISEYNVSNTNRKYLVRIDNLDYYNCLDYIIEYSMPNYVNVKSNKSLKYISDKTLIIHPCHLDTNNFKSDGRDGVITSFSSLNNGRRYNIYNKLSGCDDINYKNINEYNLSKQIDIYNRTKVLVNVHQTDYHHTFEEFRVLPILQSGVIVISEDSPLKEYIPYNEHIIWCSYSDIEYVTKEVMNNYEHYHNIIFNDKLSDIISRMKDDNIKNIRKIK